MPKLIPIIGLEIHVELKTKSKMFCSCVNDPFIDTPNTNICEVCLAHPGTLPVPNKIGIVGAIGIAQALNCTIAKNSKFDRKHYFYPDLPKGYQISQYDQPIGEHGYIELEITGANHRPTARIGITRVHMEEDTAKLNHAASGTALVDFNRAGVPLVEIVSDPDVQSAAEAKAYCQELQLIFRTLGVSNADMEKGQMRCEANVSLQTEGSFTNVNGVITPNPGVTLNSKVEVKNINSFRAVEKAIDFEIKRQTELIEKGETWIPETRGWDEKKQGTVHQRSKESSADYRYFPEPDIPPFNPSLLAKDISLPELPQAKRARFETEYGFSKADAHILTSDPEWGIFTENVMSELVEWLHCLPESKEDTEEMHLNKKQQLAKLTGGWLTSKLMGMMAERKIDIRLLRVKEENFAELMALIYTNRVNSTNAQKILIEMLDSGVDMDPTHIMEAKGYGQISDEGKLGSVADVRGRPHFGVGSVSTGVRFTVTWTSPVGVVPVSSAWISARSAACKRPSLLL
jgi:aspartyl-tRNA(Asn)/glutamyl-tRNA(Gln) amidotransferase subunit B